MAYYALPRIKAPKPQVSQRSLSNRENRAAELGAQQQQLDARQQAYEESQRPLGSFGAFVPPPQPGLGGLPPPPQIGQLPPAMQPFGMQQRQRLPGFDDGGEVDTEREEDGDQEGGRGYQSMYVPARDNILGDLRYGMGREFRGQPAPQSVGLQVDAADQAFAKAGLPPISSAITNVGPTSREQPIPGARMETGELYLQPQGGRQDPWVAMHEGVHAFEGKLNDDQRALVEALIAANPPPAGIPTAHHPPIGVERQAGTLGPNTIPIGGGPTGLTDYFDYPYGKYEELANPVYSPPLPGQAGPYGNDLQVRGQPILGQAHTGIPLSIQDFIRQNLEEMRPGRYGPGFSRGGSVGVLPGVRGFAEGGDVSSEDEDISEEERYQRFLASEAAGKEQVLINQFLAARADPASAQMMTQYQQPGNIPQEAAPYLGTWDQTAKAGGEDTRLRQDGTLLGQLNTESPNRSAYGEAIGQRALPAAALTALDATLGMAGRGAEAIGDIRLPAFGLPGGPGGPGQELQASRTISERAEQDLPYREQIHAANQFLGEAGGKAGEVYDKGFLPGSQLPWATSKAGVGSADVSRELLSHLIPETYGQAAVYGAGAALGGGGLLERAIGIPGLDEAIGGRLAPLAQRAGGALERAGGLPGVRNAVIEGLRNGERGALDFSRKGDEADAVYDALRRDIGLVNDPARRLADEVRAGNLTTDEALTRGQRMSEGAGVRGLGEAPARPSNEELQRVMAEGQTSLPPVDILPEPRSGPGGEMANPFPNMGQWYFDPETKNFGPMASLVENGIPEERLIPLRTNGEKMSMAPELRTGGAGMQPPGGRPPGAPPPDLGPVIPGRSGAPLSDFGDRPLAPMQRPAPGEQVTGEFRGRSLADVTNELNQLNTAPAGLLAERTGASDRILLGGRSQPAVEGLFSGPNGLQLPQWAGTRPGELPNVLPMGGRTQPDVVGGFVLPGGSMPWETNKGERISRLIREAQESGRPPGLPSQNLPGNRTPPVEQPLPDPGKLKLNDAEKFRIAQYYMTNQPNTPVGELSPTEIAARLYNAGLESLQANNKDGTFTPAQLKALTDRYNYADARGIKLPGEEPPSGMPDARDLVPSKDVSKLTNEQAQAQARILGFQLDPGVLEKGTREAREQELNLLRRATEDYESDVARGFNQPRAGLDQPLSLEEESQRVIAQNFAEDRKWFNDADAAQDQRQLSKNDEAEIARIEREGGGGGTGDPAQQALRNAPNESSIFSNLMGALYLPLSGDIGSALRQDAMRTLAPWHAAQTREVAGITARSMRSVEGAEAELANLRNLPNIQRVGVKVDEADVMGTDLKNKETYVADFLTRAPLGVGAVFGATNRGNAMWLNARRYLMVEDFIERFPKASKAEAQHYSNFVSRLTGRGSVPQGLSGFGPLFTSLRFLTSIPERSAYLIPWTKLSDGKISMFGPVWQEAVKEHASFFGVIAGSMGLAHEAGLQVGWDPNRQSAGPNGEPPFMTIRMGNSYLDLTGGARSYANVLYQMATGEKNGRPYPTFLDKWTDAKGREYMGGSLADFARNKGGPLPGVIMELGKLAGIDKKLGLETEANFLRPEFFDRAFGSDTFAARIASHITPVFLQDVWDAIEQNGGVKLEGGFSRSDLAKAMALPFTMLGGGMQSYHREAYQTKGMRLDEEMNKDRDKVFGPDLAAKIGKDERFSDLGSLEKQLVTARLTPEELAQVQQRAILEGDGVQKALLHQEHIKREFDDQFTSARRELARGEISPYDGRQKIQAIETKMRETMYSVKLPELPDSLKSPIQRAEGGYRAIFNAVPPKPDGKPNYEAINKIQLNYLQSVQKTYGNDFLGRLNANVQPRVGPTDHPAVKFYDTPEMRSAVTAYQRIPDNQPTSAQQKASFLIENPQREALLYAGGQVYSLHTPAALEAYKQYSAGVPEVSFFSGYVPVENNRSYDKLAVGSQAAEVREYQALSAARSDKADDYLRAHPGLNALMWQTGHTPMIYSVEAWNMVKK